MQTNNKLREALKHIQNLADALDLNEPNVIAILDTCRDALAEPVKNCDRFATLPDALAAWRDVDPRDAGPFDTWLFAPATETEGGAK